MAVAGNRGGAGGAKNIARAQRRPPRPSPTQVARTQERQYASQGTAVKKAAKQQRFQAAPVSAPGGVQAARGGRVAGRPRKRGPQPIVSRPRPSERPIQRVIAKRARLDTAASELQRKTGRRTKVVGTQLYQTGGKRFFGLLPENWHPVTPKGDIDWKRAHQDTDVNKAAAGAPVLKVMDQTMRPIHAIAGGARAAVKGQDVVKATKRGAELKDRYLFSDVLKEAGVKGPAANVAGFALDVAADPTTYVSFGAGSVARKAARDAAIQTERRAAKAGLSEAGAKTAAKQAAKRAEAKAPKGKGVTVSFAGKELPGVRRATAAVAKPVAKAVPSRVRAGARTGARQVRPSLRPAEASEAQFAGGRAAARGARASVSHAERRAVTLSRQLKKNLPADEYAAVIDAVERNNLRKLPAHLAPHAHDLRSAMKGAYRLGRRAGAVKGKVGDTGEYLTAKQRRQLRRSTEAEVRAGERRVTQLERHELRAQGKAQVAETAATGRAAREAAVATERARGRAAVATERERGAAATEFERAKGAARVSVARTKTSPTLRLREGEHTAAEQGLKRARTALKRELAKPVARRRGVAALTTRVTAARQARDSARLALRAEQKRIGGVAPREHTQLLRAIEGRERVRGPREPVARVEPGPPTGVRARKSAEAYESRAAQTQMAQRRVEAAKRVPERGLVEGHEDYLKRLVDYGRQHNLPLLTQRASKLLEAKPTGTAKGYFPRDFEDRMLKQLGLTPKQAEAHGFTRTGPGRKVSRITPGFKRAEQRRLAVVNPERAKAEQVEFSTNVPLVTLNHLKRMARATSEGEFFKQMAKLGRPIKRADDLHEGEALYKLGYKDGQFGLHEAQAIPGKPTTGGQYVALDRKVVDELQGAAQRVSATNPIARTFDKGTGLWKRAATASLAFHIRNLIGDVQQSYLVTPGHKLPRNIAQAGKAVRRSSEQARTLRPSKTEATIKVAGKRMHIDEFLAGARRNGVLDAGYIGRELRDLSGEGAERARKLGKGAGRGGQALDRWMTNRENLMRLATYKSQLDKGLSEREAAEIANHIHIDYGELSDLERKFLRRVMPFYTWTARSLPVTGKALIQRPGKFANIEKAREETGAAFSGEDELTQRSRMSQAVQRQLPFVVKVGKHPTAISASMPAILAGELPTGVTPKALGSYLDELGRFSSGMLSPGVKLPIELRTGINMVTKREIESKDRPLTSAPAWVSKLPPRLKKALDVSPDYVDKKTGRKTWGWRGKADWGYDQLMLGFAGQAAGLAGAGRAPQTLPVGIAGVLGVRADELGPAQTKHAQELRVYDELDKLNRRLGILNQRGINSSNPTPEYRQLRARVNTLQRPLRGTKAKKKTGGGGGGFSSLRGGGSSSSGSFSSLR